MLRKTLLAVGGLVLFNVAQGETMSLRQCVQTALEQNPELHAVAAQKEQAEAALQQARGGYLPRINLSVTGTRTNDAMNVFGMKLGQRKATFRDFGASQFDPENPYVLDVAPTDLNHPDALTNFTTRIEIGIPIYNGGVVRAYIQQAQAYVAAAQRGNEAARQHVAFYVLQAYEGVRAARAYIQVAQQGVESAESFVNVTQSLMKQGMVVKSDLLRAQVHRSEVEVMLHQAMNQEQLALDQLRMLMGVDMGKPVDIGAKTPLNGVSATRAIAELQTTAVDMNPSLHAMRKQIDATEAEVRVAKSDLYPKFNAMIRQDWNKDSFGFGAPAYTIGGVMSWQLYDGGNTRSAVARTRATISEQSARLRLAEEEIRVKVAESWRNEKEATTRIQAKRLAVEQAEEGQRLVHNRYQHGLATMTELLAAQAQLDKARADLVSADYDQIVSRAALLLALGELEAEKL